MSRLEPSQGVEYYSGHDLGVIIITGQPGSGLNSMSGSCHISSI